MFDLKVKKTLCIILILSLFLGETLSVFSPRTASVRISGPVDSAAIIALEQLAQSNNWQLIRSADSLCVDFGRSASADDLSLFKSWQSMYCSNSQGILTASAASAASDALGAFLPVKRQSFLSDSATLVTVSTLCSSDASAAVVQSQSISTSIKFSSDICSYLWNYICLDDSSCQLRGPPIS